MFHFRKSVIVVAALVFLLARPLSAQEAKRAPKKPKAQDTKHDAAKAKIITETVTIGRGDTKISCYLARPAGDKAAPGLLIIHEWWGLNDWVKQQAERFAGQGYVVLAVDLYRGEVAKDAEHAHELMRGLADERAVADLKAAFAYLADHKATQGHSIGVIGWCMGGGLALKLAIAEPKVACTVVCYGKPVTDVEQLKKIKGPLLGIWGATDRGIEVEPFKKALDEAGAKHTHHVYPDAGHAFLNETNKRGYNKERATEAWKEIDSFLASSLGRPPHATKTRDRDKPSTMLDLPKDDGADVRLHRSEVESSTGTNRVLAIYQKIIAAGYPASDDPRAIQAYFRHLTRGQRVALVVLELEGEVNNGGFSQYFSNSAGVFAIEAAASFREIELSRFADIAARSVAMFPNGVPPRDRKTRNKAIERIDAEKLSSLDSEFFKAYTREEEIANALDKYIESHAEEFFVD